jgi:hypothetical protein
VTGLREAWDGEALRRAALEALGSPADELAADVLRHGELAIVAGAARWDASAGPVEAHRVTLWLDARRLGALRSAHASFDALCAAVAAAVATRPGQSLLELSLRWAPCGRAVAACYRDAPPPPVTLRDALVEYLDAQGEGALAESVARAHVIVDSASEVALFREHGADAPWRSDARATGALTRAVRDLLGAARARVR